MRLDPGALRNALRTLTRRLEWLQSKGEAERNSFWQAEVQALVLVTKLLKAITAEARKRA